METIAVDGTHPQRRSNWIGNHGTSVTCTVPCEPVHVMSSGLHELTTYVIPVDQFVLPPPAPSSVVAPSVHVPSDAHSMLPPPLT